MRISDWSSDVCSSDLRHCRCGDNDRDAQYENGPITLQPARHQRDQVAESALFSFCRYEGLGRAGDPVHAGCDDVRSEEHTSELQSLMRTSYAVFCWKKNTTNKI